MKSSFMFAALVGFALLNTAFLGVYLFSSTGMIGGLSAGGSQLASSTLAGQTVTSTATSTATSGVQSGTATVMSTMASTVMSISSATGSDGISSPVPNSATSTLANTTTSGTGASLGVTAGAANMSPALSLLSVVQFFETHSLALAPSSWVAVGGMWIWRGRMRSKWTDLGFDSDVFGLFIKMKGGKTRIRLLDALSLPKDRLQLAQELGLDWKGVDRHLIVMKKYGFVDDRVAYGKVRMYQLTPMGTSLLRLLQELSREEKREEVADRQLFQSHAFSN